MTGYGKAEYAENGINLTVELRTVNNRNFDFNAKMPRAFISLEDKIRKTVSEYVKRARVDLFVNFTDTREKSVNLSVNLEKANEYYLVSKQIAEKLVANGLRAEADIRNEKLGYKIREAQLEKVPYMFIVGDKEQEEGTVSVRSRKQGDLGSLTFDDICAKLVEEDKTKRV